MKKMLRSKKGFSLVELLIVLTIIAVIAALAINVFGNVSEKSKVKADNAQIENLRKAVIAYVAETEDNDMLLFTGKDLQGMVDLMSAPITGEDVAAKTLAQDLGGKKFGPYLALNKKTGVGATGYDLPNPKEDGGKKRWAITYDKSTQNCTVEMFVATKSDEPGTFTIK